MAERVGRSFTAFTVTTKELLARPKAVSLTESEIVVVPDWLGAGVTVTVRLPPLPPNPMFAFGTRLVLEETPFSVSDVSLSLIHISEPTRQAEISYAVFCLKKKKQ